MDELGILAVMLVVGLSISLSLVAQYYPFDMTFERSFSTTLLPEYDYIIVGGGTAGSVLASRLSQDSNVTVLLLEAGGLHNWMSQVPLLSPFLQDTKLDWQYFTEPQSQSSFGLEGRKSKWPRGKGLGGSSLINYMLHLRGSANDFDRWQAESGCADWSFAELLKYFVISESIQRPSHQTNFEYDETRGYAGPLLVQRNADDCQQSKICSVQSLFLESIEESGHVVGDLNGNLEYGAMAAETNVFQGKRFSVYDAYIKPAMDRSNLAVLFHSVAQRVVFDDRSRAKGVQIFVREKLLTINAHREIILCAGSINTPQMLIVSGIGSHEELEMHKISPVAPFLPVGDNLRDHLSLPIFVRIENLTEGGSLSKEDVLQLDTLLSFIVHQNGPLTKTGVAAVARIPVPHCFNSSSPDGGDCHRSGLLLFLLDVGSLDADLYTRITNLEMSVGVDHLDTFVQMFGKQMSDGAKLDGYRFVDNMLPHDNSEGFILLVMATHPLSKGYVKLDDDFTPLINPKYLESVEDVQVMSYGIRFVASLMDMPSMKSVGARLHVPHLSECDAYEPNLEEDEFLECWIRTAAITAYHPVGTCRMGVDDESVVDCNLKVKGTQNLRVVDASVMPSPLSASPAATVVAMAERAATLIANDHN